MKILITRLIGAALFLGATSSLATANTYSVTNIPAEGTLTLRAWPSQISKPLSNIPASAQNVEATGKTIVLDSVDWLQVSYGDNTGWVEATYLTKAQAPQVATEAVTNQENNSAVINKAELFSYGETKSIINQPMPATTVSAKTIDPEADIIANSTKYPWNAAADSIYNDPKTKSHPRPIEATTADIPQINTANNQTTPATSLQASTSVVAATGPTLQTPVALTAPITQTAIVNPTPVVINANDEPVDYLGEDPSGNRYEHIETAATMGFISN